MTASSRSTITKPLTSANGSRIAATSGGRAAFRIAISSAATTAPRKPFTWTCGTIVAAISRAAADTIHETSRRSG